MILILNLNFRLRYYASEMCNQLIRYKHILLFLILLLLPSFKSLGLLSLPLAPVVNPKYGTGSLCLSVIGYVFLGIIWIHLQRDAVKGGIYKAYFETLPLANSTLIISDLIMIVVANMLLWPPFYIEAGKVLNSAQNSGTKLFSLCKLVTLAAVIVVTQWLYLNTAIKKPHISLPHFKSLLKFPLPSYFLPQLATIKANKLAFITRWLAACGIVGLSLVVDKSIVMMIAILSIHTLILSGLFSTLTCSHQTYEYFDTFACFRGIVYRYDFLLVASMSLIDSLMFYHFYANKQHLTLVSITQLPLLALLQIFQTRSPRWGAFVSLLVTLLYGWGLIIVLHWVGIT